jgi:hypothetical protein
MKRGHNFYEYMFMPCIIGWPPFEWSSQVIQQGPGVPAACLLQTRVVCYHSSRPWPRVETGRPLPACGLCRRPSEPQADLASECFNIVLTDGDTGDRPFLLSSVFFTFEVPSLPRYVYVGYRKVSVWSYIQNPVPKFQAHTHKTVAF